MKVLMIFSVCLSVVMESQLSIWVLLELNFLSFLCLLINNPTHHVNSILVYYLVQAFGSALILIAVLLLMSTFSPIWSSLLLGALVLKAGGAPFHLWYLKIISQMSWGNLWLLSVWQKVIPMALISTFASSGSLFIWGAGSALVSVTLMLAQSGLKKILGLSSVFNLGWMMMSMPTGNAFWYTYLGIYGVSLLVVTSYAANYQLSSISSVKPKSGVSANMAIMGGILMVSGLPPFPLFMMKVAVLLSSGGVVFLVLMLTTLLSLVLMYMYIMIGFYYLTLNSTNKMNLGGSFGAGPFALLWPNIVIMVYFNLAYMCSRWGSPQPLSSLLEVQMS